jgi:hypothetical protein
MGQLLKRQLCAALALAGLAAVAGLPAFAQPRAPRTMLALPPAPLLPATLGKLARVAEGDSGDGLGAVDPADQPVLTEDGLKRFARSEYTAGPEHGMVTVYKFGDASGAVAAFDYFHRSGPLSAVKIGDQTAPGPDKDIVFRSGVNVVRESFNLHGESVGGLMTELISHLPKASGTASLAPLLPTMLPVRGLEPDSVRYSLGPAGYKATGGILPPESVGFDKSAEVVTARYKGGGILTLLLYPTPQIAGDHGRSVESLLKGTGAGTVNVRREGPLVLLTTGAWGAAEAQKVVNGIHLRSEVTFDKKMPLEFHAEVAKTYSLLSSIAIFCGVGAVAAIVLGLFFGGGRALIRILQGKPAASEPEFLRIDLRGPSTRSAPETPEA